MDIKASLEKLEETVRNTALECGRNPEEIRIIAVSKRFPAGRILEASQAGQRLFGENQATKARIAARIFDCIQTVDGERIATKLDRLAGEFGKQLAVMVQVNVGGEDQKAGIEPESASDLVAVVDGCPNLKLTGLMTIPPYDENPEDTRIYFRKLRELRDTLNQGRREPLRELSMGMSHDFRVAIEEGATMIRVGTAIFGQRPPIGTRVT